jgi:ABC-type antimicrobial peptide transport system permease subunit
MMIRSSLPSAITIDSIRNNFRAKHRQIIVECRPFKEQIQSSFKRERLMALLSGLFGCLAAVLAIVGLYGVISFLVTRRQNEFGIRIALGANFGQVISLVMREALTFVGLGIPLGIVVFLTAGRGAASLLFELKPYDPATLLFAAGSLGVIGILASFVPAYRASKVDPVNTLRCD